MTHRDPKSLCLSFVEAPNDNTPEETRAPSDPEPHQAEPRLSAPILSGFFLDERTPAPCRFPGNMW